jgi:hypothetical protein
MLLKENDLKEAGNGPMAHLPIENALGPISVMTNSSGGNKIASSDRVAGWRFREHRAE